MGGFMTICHELIGASQIKIKYFKTYLITI